MRSRTVVALWGAVWWGAVAISLAIAAPAWALEAVGTATPAAAVGPPATVVHEADAIVAATGYQVVPRSLLVAYRAAFWPGESPRDALSHLIDERLLSAEARRYALAAPGPAELDRLRVRYPLPVGFSPGEWDAILLDHGLARRFLDFRFGDFGRTPRAEREGVFLAELRDRVHVRIVADALPAE